MSKIINENTPFKSLLFFHNVGTGKTLSGISVGEGLKKYVYKNNKKILIIV